MNEKDIYRCPRCKSKSLSIYEEIVHCPSCQLTFTKKFLKQLKDTAILAEEEKAVFMRFIKKEKN